MRLWFQVAALVGFLCATAATPIVAEPIQIESGLIEGVEENSARVFKGIPFAAAPIGDLRWRAPQPAPKWSDVRKADTFSPICPQQGMYPPDSPAEPMDEDCLYLNVWVPENPTGEKLAVMVWLYGGALINGSASTPLYSGARLTKRNVIVVTANYRLGVFGFLAHPDLSAEADYGTSGNYGILDKIAALHWVQRNIAAFGGDPENVTVFGQSSGSISISALVTSPLTKGLFHKAIGQSGGIFEPIELFPILSLDGAEQDGVDFLTRSGAPTIAALRQKPAEDVLSTSFNTRMILDGHALVKSPYAAYRDGEQNDVDVLVGTNADEGQLFLIDQTVNQDNFNAFLAEHFTAPLVWLLDPDPGTTDAEARAAAAVFESDMRFRWDMWRWARFASDSEKDNAYFYQFSMVPPFVQGDQFFGAGATHGIEMPYVFDTLDAQPLQWRAEDRALASTLSQYWTNFAKSGNPNGPGLPAWPAFDSTRNEVMVLGTNMGPTAIPNLELLQRIDRVYSGLRFVNDYRFLLLAVMLAILGATFWLFALGVRRWRRR